eukprot:Hpha_TRINITY_DN16110_c0_g3::TRINITY_DN16110_c0_g3_i8::g.5030::m.5030/K15356/VRG4, GONST1; GDP-mannose transporter
MPSQHRELTLPTAPNSAKLQEIPTVYELNGRGPGPASGQEIIASPSVSNGITNETRTEVTTDVESPSTEMEGESLQQLPEPDRKIDERLEMILSVVTYVVCSVSMVLLNKLVTSPLRHGFNFPMMLIFFQNLAAVVAVVFARKAGWIDFPGLNSAFVKRWLPLTAIFTLMLASSLMSLRTMSVAVVTLIKAFAIICTALGDHLLFGHPLTAMMILSFVLMYVGSCLGGGSDAWVTPEGLFYSFLNVLCTSGYQLYMKGVLEDVKKELGRWGPVYYNNLLSLPMLIVPTVMTVSGPEGWFAAIQVADGWAQFWIGTMCLLSPFMTMSTFWCITATSPTTYAVVGGMNKIPLAVLGMLIFNQWPTRLGAVGICVGLSAGFVYTWAMQRSKDKRDESVSRKVLARVGIAMAFATVAALLLRQTLRPLAS